MSYSESHSWIQENYSNIVQWAANICKGDDLQDELAHYAIEQFMTNPRYEEIMERHTRHPEHGHPRAFILSIMRNAWFGAKSEFTRYHKAHRADIGKRKRNIDEDKFNNLLEQRNEYEYDHSKDRVIEAIVGILEEMSIDNKKLWYNAKLFQMYMENPNFSALSRETGIPRTSISNAIEETKDYIKQELKNRNIDYEF